MPFPSVWKSLPAVPRKIRARIEPFQLGECHALDFASAISGSHHCRIVMNDRYSIGRHSDVELDCIGAERDCLGERLDRILGSVGAVAAMADYGAGLRITKDVHFV